MIQNKISAVIYTDSTFVGALKIYAKVILVTQDTAKIIARETSILSGVKGANPNDPKKENINAMTTKEINT